MKNKSYQTGMTLIEIMIALLIGAFLIGGVLEIFINSKQTYRMQEGLSRLQENGRFALEFLAKDIRMVGYWGCLTGLGTDIAGTNNNTATGGIDVGTDTITLKGAFVQTTTGTCGTSVVTTAAYYTDTSSTIAYKINNGVLQQDTNGQSNGLVEGIENMQILYGIDTNADHAPNYYLTANTVTTDAVWDKVVSIRISLLAATLDDNLAAQPLPYTFYGVTTTPTDLKIRRVFNATVAVRNRLP
jgi:type IV pilus assembly protein PilW